MLLQLQEPFASRWRNGYISFDTEGRKRVTFYNSQDDMWGMTYARYLMCVHLGYILPTELEVDHKDDDKTNDDFSNLQVLTKEQNLLKQQYNYIMNQQVVYGVYCACCGTPFLLLEREVKNRIAKGVELPFCSRSCAAKYHHWSRLIAA